MNNTWDFVIALVAVINGLGVIRLVTAYGEFLTHRKGGKFQHFWVYYLLVAFQLMVHFLFWWSIVGVRSAGEVNFLQFIYLLIGPTLLYLGTGVLIAESDQDSIDLKEQYLRVRADYFLIMAGFWTWVAFIWPALVGRFAPTVPFIAIFIVFNTILRITSNLRVHGFLVVASWIVYGTVIVLFAIQLGEVGRSMTQS